MQGHCGTRPNRPAVAGASFFYTRFVPDPAIGPSHAALSTKGDFSGRDARTSTGRRDGCDGPHGDGPREVCTWAVSDLLFGPLDIPSRLASNADTICIWPARNPAPIIPSHSIRYLWPDESRIRLPPRNLRAAIAADANPAARPLPRRTRCFRWRRYRCKTLMARTLLPRYACRDRKAPPHAGMFNFGHHTTPDASPRPPVCCEMMTGETPLPIQTVSVTFGYHIAKFKAQEARLAIRWLASYRLSYRYCTGGQEAISSAMK